MVQPLSTSPVQRASEFLHRCGRILSVPGANEAETHVKVGWLTIISSGDQQGMYAHLPPEHVIDAVAARARPLFLSQDRCSYGAGLKAMRRLVSATPEGVQHVPRILRLRELWDAVTQAPGRFNLITADDAGADQTWTGRDLHLAWLNGDLVHADHDKTVQGRRLDRVLAAWWFHSDLLVLADTTLRIARELDRDLGLQLPASTFDVADLPSGTVAIAQVADTYAGEGTPGTDDWTKVESTGPPQFVFCRGVDLSELHSL